MAKFRVDNVLTSKILGIFEARDHQGALDAMAREAGYADQASAAEASGTKDGEIVATRLDTKEELDQAALEAGYADYADYVEVWFAR